MPQHDLDIANQSAPNFRADLNNALEALGTLSSGSTAPSPTYANQLWYDTANNILKMRNEADSAWIDLFDLNQGAGTSFPSGVPQVIDEDSFATNSPTRPPSQQSTKVYVDGAISSIGGYTDAEARVAQSGHSYGDIGSMVFGNRNSPFTAGTNYAGSSITPSGYRYDSSSGSISPRPPTEAALTGTWKAMGSASGATGGSITFQGLFLRVA